MSKPDWEAIETAYRAGVMSLREIAAQHGISEGAIRKRAKRDDWSRDLAAKVKERADDLVRKAEVTKGASDVQQTVSHMPDDDVDRELRENFTRKT